jgi:hypothetical protein
MPPYLSSMRLLKLLLFILFPLLCAAQDTQQRERRDPRPIRERIWFGGGVGMSFGTITAIQLDPMLGYKVDQAGKLSVGLGGSYWYFDDRRFADASFVGYGYRTFTRYRVLQPVYLHAEFLHMNVETQDRFTRRLERLWVPHLLLGGGYVQRLGGRSSIFIQVLFDVWQHEQSIYRNTGPIFMGGVGVGF